MAKGLGVGTVYLIFANLIMLAANYSINVGSAYFLGPEAYGIFGLLMSIYLINRSFLNIGIPRSVSKFMAESEDKTALIYKKSLQLQLIISIAFGLIYILFSHFIAAILNDDSLQKYIIFLGIMVVPLAILALYNSGYFNGSKLFKQQALIKIIHEVLRVGGVFLFIILGFKIWGILVGYFIAIVLSVIVCHHFWKKNTIPESSPDAHFDIQKIFFFSLPITISALAFTLIKNMNTLFIKYFFGDNTLVGYYTAAMALSNITYMAFLSLPTTLMPSISRSIANNNLLLTKKYVRQSLRYLLLLLLPSTVLLSATSQGLLQLFYPTIYTAAAPALSILLWSSLFFSLFQTLGSVLSGMGKPYVETSITVISLIFLIIVNVLLIPSVGIVGAAVSTLVISILMMLAALVYVYTTFKVIMPSLSFVRILFSSIIIFGLTLWWDVTGWKMIGMYIILFLLYFSLLILLGEIKKEDYQLVRRLIPFKF
ncbi:MAG: flippase [Nanoarchaeota archaeon]|nr:flippase [Nanoarchaeota archaeon]